MPRVLVNPTAGRHGAIERLLPHLGTRLERQGARVVTTRSVEDLEQAARRAVDERAERVIVVGGDGTLHRVIQVLAGSASALGIVPAGTGNDLARALGIPTDPRAALDAALAAPIRRIDLGRVDHRFYATVAGVGFHGVVARHAAERVRWLRGPLVYPWAVVRTLFAYPPPRFRVVHEGGVFEGEAWMVLLANTALFGGGMRIAPDARFDDGRLDLVIVKRTPARTLLRLLPRVYRGGHVGHPAVVTARTLRAAIEVDRPHAVYGDGEPLGTEPHRAIAVETSRGALRVAGVAGAS